jgi:hypothetical protein
MKHNGWGIKNLGKQKKTIDFETNEKKTHHEGKSNILHESANSK